MIVGYARLRSRSVSALPAVRSTARSHSAAARERDPRLRRDTRHVTVLPAVLLGVPETTQLRHHNFAQPAGMGKTCRPNRSSMSEPMLAANTPTRSVPATTAWYLEKQKGWQSH